MHFSHYPSAEPDGRKQHYKYSVAFVHSTALHWIVQAYYAEAVIKGRFRGRNRRTPPLKPAADEVNTVLYRAIQV